jgi:putative ABC transport system permease protein
VAAAESVGQVESVLRLGGTLSAPQADDVEVFLEVLDLDSDLWAPTFEEGGLPSDRSGIVIARKAAEDLGVSVGDTVTLEHPARQGTGIVLVRTPIEVTGIHPSPFRFDAYLDRSVLAGFGVAGVANALNVLPAAGSTPDDVERELFEMSGVASVQPVAVSATVVQDSLEEFTAIFRVLQIFVLLLAVLIAYNATSINADERARERATLFAFGLRLRRVVGLETAEGVLIGLLGTLAGVGVGALVVRWIVASVWEATMPELGLEVALSGGTILTAAALGVLAVAIAPLLTIRRLRRMDIPGTLRVVE